MRIQHLVCAVTALVLVTVAARPLTGTGVGSAAPSLAADQSKNSETDKDVADALERVQSSINVLTELTKAPDDGIPANLLEGANAIVVIPTLVKGGFIVGAKHGKGIVSARRPGQAGAVSGSTWSRPGFVKMTGGNIGWQIGVAQIDLVLLVMNKEGVEELLSDKFTMGGNLSVAAGPVGRSGDAATDAKLQAGILAYSRAKGLFAGATLEGAALHADDDTNKAMYRNTPDLKTLLLQAPATDPAMPAVLQSWQNTLLKLTKR